uniref:Uncharacterized protein n=1 Tax=Sinocyclocheilus rhinocerous TaxID=307959 RepID=A0A673M6H6_9TELE
METQNAVHQPPLQNLCSLDINGNVFPYLCYKYGGETFLIPYLVFVVTCGVPLFLLETAMGQYTQEGGITCWRRLCPLAEGIGYAGQLILLYSCMCYIIILAWALFYLISSFSSQLPWASCDNTWNTGNPTVCPLQQHDLIAKP